ncbi:unnamed protein product [Chondrus crispus]|uniref:Uncharacterized protein n=1 Tax=Chondrus crispus TaxID=2769 RepID=S0F386_CHOCR|nr:unnamed protein product [Chondrus crispus]CDF77542.1 unnamed protein product [Chondrus crispus]|eukprot:XP_005717326.1 unnamed protein product [Chondrus crispus]
MRICRLGYQQIASKEAMRIGECRCIREALRSCWLELGRWKHSSLRAIVFASSRAEYTHTHTKFYCSYIHITGVMTYRLQQVDSGTIAWVPSTKVVTYTVRGVWRKSWGNDIIRRNLSIFT